MGSAKAGCSHTSRPHVFKTPFARSLLPMLLWKNNSSGIVIIIIVIIIIVIIIIVIMMYVYG